MPSTHLILWTCGPVQDAIAAARKGRDLWFGSWMLSEVGKAAAGAMLQAGADLILPAADHVLLSQPDFDVPNRVLARVSVPDPARLAEQVSVAARARLLALADAVFNHLDQHGGRGSYDRDRAREQVADMLETSWAVVADTGDDRRDRRRVEALLAARKSFRPFVAPTFAAWGVPKSSLDGQRECVTGEGAGLRLGLGDKERLCGVGLLKRLGCKVAPKGAPGGRVASVSSFALLTWLRPALDKDPKAVASAIDAFGAELSEWIPSDRLRQAVPQPLFGDLEPHAFYASRLHELVDDPKEVDRQHRKALGRLREQIAAETGVTLPATPNPYYAVLQGDGDGLGKVIDELSHADVQRVSRALSDFAQRVRDQVFSSERLEGACVYAGGDDVLALVPVDVAMRKARELSELFAQVFQEHAREVVPPPTFSVGVFVAHHLAPLRDALDGARVAERIAKDTAGRDAWALTVQKRSGGALDLWGRWPEEADLALRHLTQLSSNGEELPRGLAHDLAEAALRLHPRIDHSPFDTPTAPSGAPSALDWCELQRVLAQKGLARGPDAMERLRNRDPAKAARLEEAVDRLRREHEARGLHDLAQRLVVARTLAGLGGGA